MQTLTEPVASCKEDYHTGQFVPTINGVDTSPTSFDRERAVAIAKEQIEQCKPTKES